MEDDFDRSVRAAADRVAAEWHGVTDADDIGQEIWLRLLESPSSLEELMGMEAGHRVLSLVAIGRQIASQQRTDYDYFTGNYFYSVKDVKGVLSSGALTAERVSTNTERMDLDEGLTLLNERYRELIQQRYVWGDRMSNQSDKDALSAGIEALTDAMNRVHRNREIEYNNR